MASVNERPIRRMFLPFEDFDQQTLEILIRITLFAMDRNIYAHLLSYMNPN